MSGRLRLVPEQAVLPAGLRRPEVLRSHYGVDYSFQNLIRDMPIRWRRPITIRLDSTQPVTMSELTFVVDELAVLTRLSLSVASPLAHDSDLTATPPGEIRVGAILPDVWPPAGALPVERRRLGVGVAIRGGEKSAYESGFALLDLDRIRDANQSLVTVLRHQLGHALGLGHANRASELMSTSAAPGTLWGPGDRTGLRIAGSARTGGSRSAGIHLRRSTWSSHD